ncbi:MAG: phospholipase D family protein [Rhodoferax sp.]|nr:phospholipase D family protein [Rhodoferax sp.]
MPDPRCMSRALIALVLLALTGCAGLPSPRASTPSSAIAATHATALGDLAMRALARAAGPDAVMPSAAPGSTTAPGTPFGRSGLRPMPDPDIALDARITLIRRAQSSLDVQYYQVGNDSVGRLFLRELRDAAQRGVRVRLLIDDFYAQGMDPLLQGLAAHDHMEVRLFNPFAGGRTDTLGRLVNLAFDFKRLNHRMHNKMFVADGAMAIVGGRNMADGYFFRGVDNFIDFDAFMIGPVVGQLASIFDRYWNSVHVYPIGSIAPSADTPEALRAGFDRLVGSAALTLRAAPADSYGVPPLSQDLSLGLDRLIWAETTAFADHPNKVGNNASEAELADTALYRALRAFQETRTELLLFSPYFVPGKEGMAAMKAARDRGKAVRVVTNSMATTDEPLASLAYERYRRPMLKLGVELYELRPEPVQDPRWLPAGVGSSRALWHAKIAFIDRKTVLLGSLNLDRRSASTNTELGLLIHSPMFADRTLRYFDATRDRDVRHVYQVKLKPDGYGLQWVALKGDGLSEPMDDEPDVDYLLRLRLWLLSPFVSEELL